MEVNNVLKKPIFTEKSLKEAQNGRYTFQVDRKATKKDIALAVNKAFSVDVKQVRTWTSKGKTTRIRGTRLEKKLAPVKKASVRLAKDQKISAFDLG